MRTATEHLSNLLQRICIHCLCVRSVPQLANDIETLLCNHHVVHCDEYVITSHRALALCLARSVSLSLSYSLSSIVLCALVEPNTCVRWPHVYLGPSQVDRRMLDPESAMLQRLGACTCNSGSVPDRLRVYTQEHVCNILQELHDCTHTRKLDLYTPSRVVVSSSAAEIQRCSFQLISTNARL